jgi:predicted ATPase/DNA-binding CsgD family transcriptional regulator
MPAPGGTYAALGVTQMTVDSELFRDRLPTYLTRFVGRKRDIGELEGLLQSPGLVTVCGVGGMGKTRLAIEVARRRSASTVPGPGMDGVYWVPLTGVVGSAELPVAVGLAIGLPGLSGADPLGAVMSALREAHALLVLDNCEHLAADCAELVAGLLTACPHLVVMATSQVALEVDLEQVFAVPPLGGEAHGDLRRTDATDLFIERATAVATGYPLTAANAEAIGQICRRLDGLPLAIELAASWIRVLSARDLLSQLEEAMQAPGSSGLGVAERHRSVRAVLDGSWQWLRDQDRSVLAGLAVFVGGFTRQAAEAVTGATLATLATLVERSLIQRLPDTVGGTRYHVHELVRSYALERLADAGQQAVDAARMRHFDYFVQLSDGYEQSWDTPIEPELRNPLAADAANFDAAMLWALDQGDAERALRIVDAMFAFWLYSSTSFATRRDRLLRALALPWNPSGPAAIRTRAKALNQRAFHVAPDDPTAATALFTEGLALMQQAGDQAGVAASLRGCATVCAQTGDAAGARRYSMEARTICRAVGDRQGELWGCFGLARAAFVAGDFAEATKLFTEAKAGFEGQNALFGAYASLVWLADLSRVEGHWAAAVKAYRQALDRMRAHRFTVHGVDLLDGLALAAAALGHFEASARLFGAAASWFDTHGAEIRTALDKDALDQAVRTLRFRLGDNAWAQAYAGGRGLTFAQALELAEEVIHELAVALDRRQVGLTGRELEVLQLLRLGLANADIADRLVLSQRTVHAHVRSIFTKLGVTTRTAAVHEATRLHLI